jgi:integrase
MLAHLAGYNAATDRRYEQRALTPEEFELLIAITENGPRWRNSLSGLDRAMLYRTAAGTGFRLSELATLTPTRFHLDEDPPAISLCAAKFKRRRDDRRPVREDLARLLESWLSEKPANMCVWPGHWHDQGAEMVRADLRRARAHQFAHCGFGKLPSPL